MRNIFDAASVIALRAVRENLPESTSVGAVALVPRGADPFFGGTRPMLIGGVRLAAVPPGGVLIGGAPETVAELLGFALEADAPAEPGTAEPATEPAQPAAPPPGAPAAPANAGNEAGAAGNAADAARGPLGKLATAVAVELARAAGLPTECTPAEVSLTGDPRPHVGALPDALVVQLGEPRDDVRLVVVLPAIMLARLGVPTTDEPRESRHAADEEPGREPGPAIVGDRLGEVPLDLGLLLGVARMPLAQIVGLADGDVVQLDEAVDAPVQLASGETTVAWGDLEVEDDGGLVLRVTGVPGPGQPGA